MVRGYFKPLRHFLAIKKQEILTTLIENGVLFLSSWDIPVFKIFISLFIPLPTNRNLIQEPIN